MPFALRDGEPVVVVPPMDTGCIVGGTDEQVLDADVLRDRNRRKESFPKVEILTLQSKNHKVEVEGQWAAVFFTAINGVRIAKFHFVGPYDKNSNNQIMYVEVKNGRKITKLMNGDVFFELEGA